MSLLRFFAGLDGWVFREIWALRAILSSIWRSWCHAHDVRHCVRFFFLGEKVLVPQSVLCACCGFRECPMMMQIRLPLLNGLLGVFGDSSPICSAAFLLRTSWIRHVHGGRSLQYNAVFCGAHVCSHAACGHHRFVVIGFDLDDVHRSGACVLFRCCQANLGSRFSCLSLVMRGRHVELWIGSFLMSGHGSSARFFDGLASWVFRAILALSAICR